MQLGLIEVLFAYGASPAAVIGHSSGEIAAGYASGFFDLRAAITAAYYRGKHMSATTRPGRMLAVGLSRDEIVKQGYLDTEGVDLGCINSPVSCTLSGDADAIISLGDRLQTDGTFARVLRTQTAFHSRHMHPLGDAYHAALINAHITGQRPQDHSHPRFFSSVYGREMCGEEMTAAYLVKNMTSTVNFSAAMASLLAELNIQSATFVEIGPHPALKAPVHDIWGIQASVKQMTYHASLVRGENDRMSLLRLAAKLLSAGQPIDMDAVNYITVPKLLRRIPALPWDHSSEHWYRSWAGTQQQLSIKKNAANRTVLGREVSEAFKGDLVRTWKRIETVPQEPWKLNALLLSKLVNVLLEAHSDPTWLHVRDLVLGCATPSPKAELWTSLEEGDGWRKLRIHVLNADGSKESVLSALVAVAGPFQQPVSINAVEDRIAQLLHIVQNQAQSIWPERDFIGSFSTIRACKIKIGSDPLDAFNARSRVIPHEKLLISLCGISGISQFELDGVELNQDTSNSKLNVKLIRKPNITQLSRAELEHMCRTSEIGAYQTLRYRRELEEVEALALLLFERTLRKVDIETIPNDFHRHFYTWMKKQRASVSTHPLLSEKQLSHYAKLGTEVLWARIESTHERLDGHLVHRIGQRLEGILLGNDDALELMLQDDLLQRFYANSFGLSEAYDSLRKVIDLLGHREPNAKFCEIGGGTGGATESILKVLCNETGRRCDLYTFTDISPGFFGPARSRFSQYQRFIEMKTLNIEQDPTEKQVSFFLILEMISVAEIGSHHFHKGFESESYDVVVAVNVLHATKSIRETLKNVARLLKPGGYLVMLEITNGETVPIFLC